MLVRNTDAGLPRRKYTVDSVTKAVGNSNYTAQRTSQFSLTGKI